MRPPVAEAMLGAFELIGNPSSVHQYGRDARRALQRSRQVVADHIGTQPANIVFTSGGTEANNLALAQSNGPILVSAIEHPSVLEAADVIKINVNPDGMVDLKNLSQTLKNTGATLVSVMLANNETGVIQPIKECAKIVRDARARLHVDAVQALGKVDQMFDQLTVDYVSISAHKIGGPRGVGALIFADGREPKATMRGGGQEMRHRAGTENLAGIIGFAAAIEALDDDQSLRYAKIRDHLEESISDHTGQARIIAKDSPRLPNTSNIALPGVASETQVIALDLGGIAVSAGAACSSGKVARSHVLEAMGEDPSIAGSAIRVSVGWDTKHKDIDRFIAVWSEMAGRLSPAAKSHPITKCQS